MTGWPRGATAIAKRDFKISLAGWSLNKEIRGGKIKAADVFQIVREDYDLGAYELVNTLLEVPTAAYVNRLRGLSEKFEVEIPLIMIDAEGSLGGPSFEEREKAVRNCAKWVYIASDLGCHSIRVNWRGEDPGTIGDEEKSRDLIARSVHAYAELCAMARKNGINVLIENHFGPSSYPDLLMKLIDDVAVENFGTLPDFGNFPDDVDRYDAVDRMMPKAKAVSAKCNDFGPDGNETVTDFERMLQICVDKHGYHGYIGIEYGGRRLSEREGIKACRDLLIRLRDGE